MLQRSPRLISYTVDQRRHHAGNDLDSAGSSHRYSPITLAEAQAAIAAYDHPLPVAYCTRCDQLGQLCSCRAA